MQPLSQTNSLVVTVLAVDLDQFAATVVSTKLRLVCGAQRETLKSKDVAQWGAAVEFLPPVDTISITVHIKDASACLCSGYDVFGTTSIPLCSLDTSTTTGATEGFFPFAHGHGGVRLAFEWSADVAPCSRVHLPWRRHAHCADCNAPVCKHCSFLSDRGVVCRACVAAKRALVLSPVASATASETDSDGASAPMPLPTIEPLSFPVPDDDHVSAADFQVVGAMDSVLVVRKSHGSDAGTMYALRPTLKTPASLPGLIRAKAVVEAFDHPHVLAPLYLFQTATTAYEVASTAARQPLTTLLGGVDEIEGAQLLARVLAGLAHVHARGYVHGAVSSANVLLGHDGTVVLAGFEHVTPLASEGAIVDWHAFGLLVYQLFVGAGPLTEATFLTDATCRQHGLPHAGRDLCLALFSATKESTATDFMATDFFFGVDWTTLDTTPAPHPSDAPQLDDVPTDAFDLALLQARVFANDPGVWPLYIPEYAYARATTVGGSDFAVLGTLTTPTHDEVHLVQKLTGTDAGAYYALQCTVKATARPPAIDVSSLRHATLVPTRYRFQTRTTAFVVTPVLRGHTLRSIQKTTGLDEREVAWYLSQVFLGLAYLHAHGVAHGSLSLQNVVVTDDATAVFARTDAFVPLTASTRRADFIAFGDLLTQLLADKAILSDAATDLLSAYTSGTTIDVGHSLFFSWIAWDLMCTDAFHLDVSRPIGRFLSADNGRPCTRLFEDDLTHPCVHWPNFVFPPRTSSTTAM
ncbi:hypothetical protein SPRG_08356 [Saprolegnia parasitica CBS 223.65]|uniref:Protein kinase domain-containing protein n=1 Tax=Saprolegnia parasitica (strain CBS 223.65) TaxID=695850 RepID=A0A067CIC4_SAPPC|nr:hypothetical protein SPRG_08356 [Saprolegnia parasitica CBS 223.65]KDO26281.1 hypothetical protein SPRG_08356 [Saprolegnia parasitica CBS 223.65]|eukprot:XP_012202986.1 hypothetical protein SPRG_08356 [Saprolegnia parasitica CBS 223.65]